MKTNTTSSDKTEPQNNFSEETKNPSLKHLSKFEYDLYNEEDDIALPVIRVKHFSLPNNGDKWKFFENKKVAFVLEGSKLLKKEKEYLHTIEGFNFMLSQAKIGVKSLNSFKIELKKMIENAPAKIELQDKKKK